jgi:hypothetical protein
VTERQAHRSQPVWDVAVVGAGPAGTIVGGYLLGSSVTTEPFLLVADLLYALGWALWTGVVVVLFVQIFPGGKWCQIKRVLDAYEAALRDKAAGNDGAPTAR